MKLSRKIFIAAVAFSSASIAAISSPVQAEENRPVPRSPFDVGMTAPGADVGKTDIQKGTVTFSSNVGTSDQFSLGTVSAMSAAANISATPDYNVTSTATFKIGDNTNIQQTIGQGVDIEKGKLTGSGGPITEGSYGEGTAFSSNMGKITGNFEKTAAIGTNPAKNEVTVEGIGTNADIAAKADSSFVTNIVKNTSAPGPDQPTLFVSAGTASGGASGTVNTSTSASASSSEFVSSFAQAY